MSILRSLKTIVLKTRRRLSWRGRVNDENVSAVEANLIQREAYNHNQNVRHTVYTPPYLELAAQLLAPELQIFEAAASHLTAIAQARPKYAPEIKRIFTEVIAGRRLSPEKTDYLTRKINEIRL
jgi:hypothetical protein